MMVGGGMLGLAYRYCEPCGIPVRAYSSLSYVRLPPFLVIHLVRMLFSLQVSAAKGCSVLPFPRSPAMPLADLFL